MKKILSVFAALLMISVFAFVSMAADYDLAEAGSGDMAAFEKEIEGGRRFFDQACVLSEAEAAELEESLREFEKTYGQMAVIITVRNQTVSEDLDVYADRLYTEGRLGTGADRDGVLLVLDMGDSGPEGVHIYAQSGAMRYMTDRAIDQIYDEYDGGIYSPLSDGDYYQAFLIYTEALDALYRQGVQSGQYNYDPVTGEKDYYGTQRRVKLWHVLMAMAIAGISAYLPVASTKRSYAMTVEKKRAQYVNLAYRAESQFAYANAKDALVNTRTVHIPIPRPEPSHSGGGHSPLGGSSFGGGHSTMHSSGGGGFHSSGGRKF